MTWPNIQRRQSIYSSIIDVLQFIVVYNLLFVSTNKHSIVNWLPL